MTDEIDVDAMLEAPLHEEARKRKKSKRSKSPESYRRKKSRSRSRDRKDKKLDRHRDKKKKSRSREDGDKRRSVDRKRSNTNDRRRSRSIDRHRSRTNDRKRSRSYERKRSRSNDRRMSRIIERDRSESFDRRSKSIEEQRSDSMDRRWSKSKDRSRSIDRRRSRSIDRRRSRSIDRRKSKSIDRRRSRSNRRRRSRSIDRRRSRSIDRHRSRSIDRRKSRSIDRRKSRSIDRHRSRSTGRRRSRSFERRRSRSNGRKKSKSLERRRSRSVEQRGSRINDLRRSRSNDRRRSRSNDRRRSRSNERRRSRSRERRSRDRRRAHSRDRRRYSRSISPFESREPSPELSTIERDARTVFAWQLSARIRQRDLEKFFSKVGKIRCVKLIMDNKTRKSKGIAYIEFREIESAQNALKLTGTRLLGVPIQVQLSHAEKSRMGMLGMGKLSGYDGPLKLYVGSLHYNITEEMIRGIFEPFGTLDEVKVIRDPTTGRSQGYGFVYFANANEGKKALEQLNGFEVASRPMKVNYVTERIEGNVSLDSDETDRTGVGLGATGRLALMAKLAEGTGLEIPKSAMASLHAPQQVQAPPVCTQCFMLTNMFDPLTASSTLISEIKEDVLDECSKLGGVLHIYLDRTSQNGNVYVKCVSIAAATQCVRMLHGRYFSERLITANYVPLVNYHELFPESATANTLLKPISY